MDDRQPEPLQEGKGPPMRRESGPGGRVTRPLTGGLAMDKAGPESLS